jgi:hypothetical protein
MAVFMAGAIVAIIERGPRQAFAIGMVLTMVIYAILVRNGVSAERGINRELNPEDGRLPTTRISSYFYRPVVTFQWFDATRNTVLPNYYPNNPPTGLRDGVFRTTNKSPSSEHFMQISHGWWALLLGYVGGRFAQFVYIRRTNDPLRPEPYRQ